VWGHAIAVWSSLYANHAALRTAVEFTHIGGLLAGGGCAITADLATLSAVAVRDGAGAGARSAPLDLLQRTHRLVVSGLIALFVSGALLLAADVETYWFSRIFWLKMGLIGVLLANGALLVRREREARRGSDQAWAQLHRTALVSLALWFATTLAGAALPNIG
jgi:hypothetical protein